MPFDCATYEAGYRAGIEAAAKERATPAMDEVAGVARPRSDGGEDRGVVDPRARPEETLPYGNDTIDIGLLERMAAGGGRRTGALRRCGLIEWEITELGRAILKARRS